jgi:hypothetical protein
MYDLKVDKRVKREKKGKERKEEREVVIAYFYSFFL